MTLPLAAAALAAILAAAPAPTKPLFDTKPAVIEGVRYGPEKVFEGDYFTNFESSVFVPMGRPKDAMWLLGWKDAPGDTDNGRTYHIRFIGRRTVKAARYGNLGAFRRRVLIAELINAQVNPAP